MRKTVAKFLAWLDFCARENWRGELRKAGRTEDEIKELEDGMTLRRKER